MKPEELLERERICDRVAEVEDNGYYSLVGQGRFSLLAYVCLPEGHSDTDKKYFDLCTEKLDWGPDVNGGLTFSNGRVFGWDYGHAKNSNDIKGDIKRTIDFFHKRWQKGGTV